MKNDVTFVAIMIAFFALAALFVIACDKIIGSDEEALAIGEDVDSVDVTTDQLAA